MSVCSCLDTGRSIRMRVSNDATCYMIFACNPPAPPPPLPHNATQTPTSGFIPLPLTPSPTPHLASILQSQMLSRRSAELLWRKCTLLHSLKFAVGSPIQPCVMLSLSLYYVAGATSIELLRFSPEGRVNTLIRRLDCWHCLPVSPFPIEITQSGSHSAVV